jgi:phage terminase large subunit GpA-like protein
MIEHGRWEATATGEPGVRSYHLNELASKFSTLESVAQQAEDAKTPEQKQAFYNTTLAQVYDAGTEVELSSSELQQRAEPIMQPYASNRV